MSERLFKFLAEDGTPRHGGTGAWPLPTDDTPGDWRTVTGKLVPCRNGLHLCRVQDLAQWPAPALYEAEYRGERIDHDDKIVVREARLLHRVENWNERTMQLWACDCAERVLHLYERESRDDSRPREAIAVARRFANGEATSDELAAAGDAAWAARDAARAARAAAGDAAWAARDAAWHAARDAAWDAAWAARDAARAARAAAWHAAGAAWDAARAAAGDAAWAARDAARAARAAAGDAAWAARDAAWHAARDAAWDDERTWQLDRLMAYLDGVAP